MSWTGSDPGVGSGRSVGAGRSVASAVGTVLWRATVGVGSSCRRQEASTRATKSPNPIKRSDRFVVIWLRSSGHRVGRVICADRRSNMGVRRERPRPSRKPYYYRYNQHDMLEAVTCRQYTNVRGGGKVPRYDVPGASRLVCLQKRAFKCLARERTQNCLYAELRIVFVASACGKRDGRIYLPISPIPGCFFWRETT